MSIETNMNLVLTLLITFQLMIGMIIWRRASSRPWVKNVVFTTISVLIVASWILIVYAIIHFGPALAK